MYDFHYHRPASLKDAEALLAKNEDAKLLSGGMTLIPTLKQRLAQPSDIIDLGGIKNAGITVSGGKVTVKGGTTHAAVAESEEVRKAIPALAKLAGGIGDPHVRHRGTIGGSIANNDPAADYPAAVVGLNATVVTNKRSIKADEFFTGMFETALGRDEIVTAVEFPVPKKAGYAKFPNPASRYAMVGVFAAETDGGVRVAVTGAGPCVFRFADLEKAMPGGLNADAVAGVKLSPDDLNSDMHASAEYRAHLVSVMAKRAIAAAG